MTNGEGGRESNRHDQPASHKVVVDQAVLMDFTQAVTNSGLVAAELNTRPRKRLGWLTPAEALDKLLAEASTHPVLR